MAFVAGDARYAKQAKTPTLIQHGENDQRVPIPNAYERYQGVCRIRACR